jgi:TonB family protein
MQTLARTVSAPSFALLLESASRWKYFSTSTVAQALLLVVLARFPFSLAVPVLQPVDTHESVHLVAPDLTPPVQKHDEVVAVQKPPVPLLKPTLEVLLPEPKKRVDEIPPKPGEVAKATIPMPRLQRRVVSTDFGSSAPVTLQKPAHQVQMGGFGDLNGVPANSSSPTNKGPMIAKLGSFDLPSGVGTGNGTGGATGAKGTVASAGFDSTDPVSAASAAKRQASTSASKDEPVSLLSKPTPTYTTEARRKKIEGDVELDVEFTATGQIHVLRVLQGLGYGLDEAAVAAAQQIRFSPARRDGQPVDSQGRLRIVFRVS